MLACRKLKKGGPICFGGEEGTLIGSTYEECGWSAALLYVLNWPDNGDTLITHGTYRRYAGSHGMWMRYIQACFYIISNLGPKLNVSNIVNNVENMLTLSLPMDYPMLYHSNHWNRGNMSWYKNTCLMAGRMTHGPQLRYMWWLGLGLSFNGVGYYSKVMAMSS